MIAPEDVQFFEASTEFTGADQIAVSIVADKNSAMSNTGFGIACSAERFLSTCL